MKLLRSSSMARRVVTALSVLVAMGVMAPQALADGSLSVDRGLAPSPNLDTTNVLDLTALGTLDWAVWGTGSSTTLTPAARKSVFAPSISALQDINPTTAPLRGIGQFTPPGTPHAFTFSWTDGLSPLTGTAVRAGIQHNGQDATLPNPVSTNGAGFKLSVAADTSFRTLRLWVALNRAEGTLTASLSDGSAAQVTDAWGSIVNDFQGAVYTITYKANGPGQTLDVQWVETQDFCATEGQCDNVSVHAAALTTGAPGGTLVVNSAGSAADGACDEGNCTLADAIVAANATPGLDEIVFAVPTSGPVQIAIPTATPLPAVTAPISIDGETQRAFQQGSDGAYTAPPAGTKAVVLVGPDAGFFATPVSGLVLAPSAGGSTVRGLGVRDFDSGNAAGIVVQGDGNVVVGNHVGTAADGLTAAGNAIGIAVTGGDGNRIGGTDPAERNVVSGNGVGIEVSGSSNTRVTGNFVGTDATGLAPVPNGSGISVVNGGEGTVVGGTSLAAGNVVVGGSEGITITNAPGALVRFNTVGLAADGASDIGGFGAWAIALSSSDGATVADNVAANAQGNESGITISSSSDVRIVRNKVGTDRAGTLDQGNGQGIRIDGNTELNETGIVIGGSVADANVVSHNRQEGIYLVGVADSTVSHNTVVDNGSDPSGIVAYDGILVDASFSVDIGPGNTISASGANGVSVIDSSNEGSAGVVITQNAISGNGLGVEVTGLGIDLGAGASPDGITPNDPLDADSGPNSLQNFPTLTSATPDGESTLVEGAIATRPSVGVTIELFSQPTCDAPGNGEAATYLTSATVTADALGIASYEAVVPTALPQGTVLTATATTGEGTSEISECLTVVVNAPDSVTATLGVDDATVEAGASSVDIAKLPLSAIVPPATPITQQPITQQPITQQPITQQPITQQPITQQPITQQPITQQPITQQPLADFGFAGLGPLLADPAGVLAKALGGVTLDTLPTSYPGGWPAILAGVPSLAGRPEQNVTLRDLLTATPTPPALDPSSPQALRIGQIDFTNSKLASLPLFALAFGDAPLLSFDPLDISAVTGTAFFPDGQPVPQLSAAANWAAILAGPPFDCANSCSLAGQSVISAALAGAPITQQPITQQPATQQPITQQPITQQPITQQAVADLPLADLPLQAPITQQPITQQPITQQPVTYLATSASPITQQPITQQPITQQGGPVLPAPIAGLSLIDILASGRSFPACGAGGRLGAVSQLGTITVASLTARTTITTATTGTLAQAYCAGAIVPTATLQTLANAVDLREFTLGDIAWYGDLTVTDLLVVLGADIARYTLGDLVALMIDRRSVDWESLSPEALSSVGENPAGLMTLTTTFTLNGSDAFSGPAVVELTLPPFARYVPGSARRGLVALPDPTVTTVIDGTEKRSVLRIPLTAVPFLVQQQVSVQAYAGFVLGPQDADVVVRTTPTGPTATSALGITVGDTFGDSGAGNDTPATATALPAGADVTEPGGEVIQSYIRSAGDIDVFRIPSPGPGYRISAHLTNLPTDLDLSITGPGTPPLRATTPGAPLQDPPIRDGGVTTENRNTSLEPAAAQDLPITQQPITQQPLDQSQNRGTNAEDAGVETTALEGDYLVRVAGYNGARSDLPYSLRVEVTPVAAEPSCSPWPYAANAGTPGTPPLSVPAGTNTLFLVSQRRLGQSYDPTRASAVVSGLTTIAGQSALGVSGAVIPVDGFPDVLQAYAAWDANPCSATASNAVASAIAAHVDAYRQAVPTIRYVVIVGGFDQIPPFALPDVTRIANETGYASTFADNQYFGWASTGKVLSDDPYYDTDPVALGSAQVYVPDLLGGRLVETPEQILSQLAQFTASGGALDRTSAFVSGYDFVKDGANAANAALSTIQKPTGGAIDVRPPLVNDVFLRNDLLTALLPPTGGASLNVVNGHFDNYRTLTAGGSASGTLDVVTTADLPAVPGALQGSVLLTVGCHSGLAVSDVIVGTTAPVARDWAESFGVQQAHWAANTGYGLGDTDIVAYSEQLVVNMARRLDGSVSIGEAMTRAKADYYLQRAGNLTAYDRKAMSELTLYGLPFYGVGVAPTAIPGAPAGLPAGPVPGTTTATAPADGAIGTDPVSGLQSASFTATPVFTLSPDTGRGRFYSNAGGVNYANYRPIVPALRMNATRAGLVPHSPFVEALSSQDDAPFDPVYQTPITDQASVSPELTFGDAGFPTKLPSLVTTTIGGQAISQLNLGTGQFFIPEGSTAPRGVGVMRRFTQISGRVFYSPPGVTDFDPPTVLRTTATFQAGTVVFSVEVDDPTTRRVYVLFRDGSGDAWKPLDLIQAASGATRWTGGRAAAGSGIEYIVQACDPNGNCGWSSNKATYFKTTAPPAAVGAIQVALSGSGGPALFGGPVLASATAPAGVTLSYAVDDGPSVVGASVTVASDGPHTVRFTGSDGSSRTVAFAVDGTPPTVTVTVPVQGATYPATPPTVSSFACSDGTGSGIQSCVATLDGQPHQSGQSLGAAGPHTLVVTATDFTGRTASVTRTYTVAAGFSVDGKIVFSRLGDLWAVTPAGVLTQLTSGPAVDLTPARSPDGTRVVFSRNGDLWVLTASGASPLSVANQLLSAELSPAWSPDGQRIVFSSNRSGSRGFDIWSVNASGTGGATNLTNANGADLTPAWSPDGGSIVFASDRPGQFDVYRMTATGGSVTRLTTSTAADLDPVYAPDGSAIAFASNRNGAAASFDVYRMTPTGVSQTRLTTAAGADGEPYWVPGTAAFGSLAGRIVFTSLRLTGGSPGLWQMTSTGASQARIPQTGPIDINPG